MFPIQFGDFLQKNTLKTLKWLMIMYLWSVVQISLRTRRYDRYSDTKLQKEI